MFSGSPTYAVILACIFAAMFLCAQLIIGGMKYATRKAGFANYRLKMLDAEESGTVVLERMRKKRGLDADGQLGEFLRFLGKLVLHSGLRIRVWMVPAGMVALSLTLGLISWMVKENLAISAVAMAAGAFLPIAVLMKLGTRRRNKAVSQLPDSLDVVIRSLSAGHPVPVAMKLVGREMPDPLGSEFGIASDEIGFGAGVATAVQRMADRIDHDDMYLFAAMVRLQERTGGNLAELLRANAKTIRDRQTMRLRIKAASAEGRMSALILNLAPIGVLIAVNLLAPDFYGDVAGHPWMKYAGWGVVIWMGIGNLIIRRMINFRI